MHPKLSIIEKYKDLGQALDIPYRTPSHPAEQRRITLLFIERRGEVTFVIAYCQTPAVRNAPSGLTALKRQGHARRLYLPGQPVCP
jgi:hypothetical protein